MTKSILRKEMPRQYYPHYNHRKEYESNLSEFRIQAGLTVSELCEKVNIHMSEYANLNSGTSSPFWYGTTKIKPSVIRLADVLNADLEDLFPRYFCTLNKLEELTVDEIIDNFHPEKRSPDFDDPELLLLRKERSDILKNLIKTLSDKERFIVVKYFIEGINIVELGKQLNISKQAVSELKNKGWNKILQKIKHNSDYESVLKDNLILEEKTLCVI